MLGSRLWIKRLELAGPAGHPEEDTSHLTLAQVFGVKCHPIGEADRYRRRSGKAGCSETDCLQEAPAVDHAPRAHCHPHHLSFQCHGTSPRGFTGNYFRCALAFGRIDSCNRVLTPSQKLGGVDQAPVDIFKSLARVSNAREITAADVYF